MEGALGWTENVDGESVPDRRKVHDGPRGALRGAEADLQPDLPFPKEVFAERRAAFQRELGAGVAIIPGGRLVHRANDVHHVFRQRSDLLYLTGFPQPDAVAVLSADVFCLFVQPRDRELETWNGRRPGTEGAVALYGADEAYPIEELDARLPEMLENVPTLFHRFGDDEQIDRSVLRALAALRAKERRGVIVPDPIADPYTTLHEQRLHKRPEEIEVMRRAAEISREAHGAAARRARSGAHEYELEAELLHVFRNRGGAGPAYPSIVASGDNATILHYTENCSPLRAGEVVLIDAGVELQGYASDVTRTYPVDGRFAGAARDVYDAVLEAQRAAIASIEPGASSLRSIHDAALRSLTQSLIDLGAICGDVDLAIKNEAYRPFYMHGTGHFLGLDVHDAGVAIRGDVPRVLEAGMAFTIEPGLYFSSESEATPEALRGIGVRIEDDVVMTEDGFEILTADIPKARDDVEAWMRE